VGEVTDSETDEVAAHWWRRHHRRLTPLVVHDHVTLYTGITLTTLINHGRLVLSRHRSASVHHDTIRYDRQTADRLRTKLECGQMPLLNIGGALCSTTQSLADAHYCSAVQ